MTINHFVWTDLSTYDVPTAMEDYASFFGWAFHDAGGYQFAYQGASEIAAVFEMPSRLAEIQMPSFWMSYVHVADVDETVAKAQKHDGAIIEVAPQSFGDDARIALIRDPSGAGFTVYEGPDITPATQGTGSVTQRFHHSPDIRLIQNFYADLFGWSFRKTQAEPWPVFEIIDANGTPVALAEEVPEEIRGKFRYWMPCFQVENRSQTAALIEANAGSIFGDLGDGRTMIADQQGAHFMITDQSA